MTSDLWHFCFLWPFVGLVLAPMSLAGGKNDKHRIKWNLHGSVWSSPMSCDVSFMMCWLLVGPLHLSMFLCTYAYSTSPDFLSVWNAVEIPEGLTAPWCLSSEQMIPSQTPMFATVGIPLKSQHKKKKTFGDYNFYSVTLMLQVLFNVYRQPTVQDNCVVQMDITAHSETVLPSPKEWVHTSQTPSSVLQYILYLFFLFHSLALDRLWCLRCLHT